jgi:hypothetical protein
MFQKISALLKKFLLRNISETNLPIRLRPIEAYAVVSVTDPKIMIWDIFGELKDARNHQVVYEKLFEKDFHVVKVNIQKSG